MDVAAASGSSDKEHHQCAYTLATSSNDNAGLDSRNRLRLSIASN